jgi:hypothetical protein
MANDPWALPNPILLVVLILAGAVVALALAFQAISGLVRRGFRKGRERLTYGYLSRLAWAAAIATYSWGAHNLLQDETSADQACRAAVGQDHAGHVDRYVTSFFPLHFGCHVNGAGTFEATVPGYLNPTIVALLLVAIALTILTSFASSPTDPRAAAISGAREARRRRPPAERGPTGR